MILSRPPVSIVLAMALSVPLLGAASPATSSTPGHCYSDWSDAAPIVAREGLLAARDIHLLARRRHASEIMRITLCREGAGYVYRLLLRDDRGRISSLKIDAAAHAAPAITSSASVDGPTR